jgi:sulfoxide reductase heme-binding subunit YedZ
VTAPAIESPRVERRPPRPRPSPRRRSPAARLTYWAIFVVAAAPGLYLAWQLYLAWTGQPHTLGEEPVETLEHQTGELAIRFLGFTLLVSPLRWLGTLPPLAGWPRLAAALRAVQPYRRTLGLFMFWYTTAHLATYVVLDLELQLGEVVAEIVKRPYITVGFAAWLLLVPLAVTSTTGWIRRLGGKRWATLHQLTYTVAVLAIVHYWWSQKKDVTEPLLWAIGFAALLAWRGWRARAAKTRVAA